MNETLHIIGLGPGNSTLQTVEVHQLLPSLTDIVGYKPYVKRLSLPASIRLHTSDNRQELARAQYALNLAKSKLHVAVVSSGDAGVFGMAAAIFEIIDRAPELYQSINIQVHPGVSAMFCAAARLGAPLGNDFCAISLSDNLKPWPIILKRLQKAAEAEFVIALYNTVSKARPWQLDEAFKLLKRLLLPTVPVAFCQAITKEDENIQIVPLEKADASKSNMQTLIIIGNQYSRTLSSDKSPSGQWFYTPRFIDNNSI